HMLSCSVVTVLFLVSAVTSYADKSHDGKVVSVTEASGSNAGKIVMTDKEGKGQHSHAISSSVMIARNDKTVKLGELKNGASITVTTADDGSVKQVAATDSSSASRRAGSNGKSEKGDICECLMKLDLSSDQKAKVKEISAKYDEQWEATWREFS